MLRKGADSALVELTFSCDDVACAKLEEMDIPVEDVITISRRMSVGKSISKINGETVNLRQIKEIAEYLIDIHGQHEHQSLLQKKKHLEILDSFCGKEGREALERVSTLYQEVKKIKSKIQEEALDEESKICKQITFVSVTRKDDTVELWLGGDNVDWRSFVASSIYSKMYRCFEIVCKKHSLKFVAKIKSRMK